jgi:hypothetical protein
LLLPGALLILFGLGCGVMLAGGRADFGAEQALASRYITLSNTFWIGLLLVTTVLLVNVRGGVRSRGRPALIGIALFIGSIAAYGNTLGLEQTRQFSHLERVLRYKLLNGEQDAQLEMLFPNPRALSRYRDMTEKYDLWAWRPGAPASMFEPPPLSYDE